VEPFIVRETFGERSAQKVDRTVAIAPMSFDARPLEQRFTVKERTLYLLQGGVDLFCSSLIANPDRKPPDRTQRP